MKGSNSFILFTDRTLTGAITSGQNGLGSNDNEGVLHSQISRICHRMQFSVICRTLLCRGSYLSAEMQLGYSTAPADCAGNSARRRKTLNSNCLYPEEIITLIYNNMLLFFITKVTKWLCQSQEPLKLYNRLRYDIFREACFFALPPRGWYRADLKYFNNLPFFFVLPGTGQFITKASTRLSRFLLGSYSLSTLASLVHWDFSLFLNLWPSTPRPSQRTEPGDSLCLLCSALYSLLSTLGSKISSLYIYIFWTPTHLVVLLPTAYPTHAIYVAFPLSCLR